MNAESQEVLVHRLVNKIRSTRDKIYPRRRRPMSDDAEVVVVSYGITSRVAVEAIALARKPGDQGRNAEAHHLLALP